MTTKLVQSTTPTATTSNLAMIDTTSNNCFEIKNLTLCDSTEYSTVEGPTKYESDDDQKIDDSFSTLSLLSQLQTVSEEFILAEHGYTMIEKITDTIQGELIKCKVESKEQDEYVAIKRTKKELFKSRIAMEDGMSVLVNENIVKEGVIQHYLTGFCIYQ